MATVLKRVIAVVADKLDAKEEDIHPETRFTEDLNADSLDLVELVMALEQEFEDREQNPLEISDEDAGKLTTVREAVDYIIAKGVKDE